MNILHIINHMEMGGAQSLIAELAPIQRQMGHNVTVLELVASKNKILINRLLEHGVLCDVLSEKRHVRNPISIFYLIPHIRKCDIVHVHLFPANYWVAFAKLLSFSNVPMITTEHSTDNKRRRIPIFKYIDTFIYRRYSEVVACGDKALEMFKQRYPCVNCISIPNGIDLSRFIGAIPYSKRELLGVDDNTFLTTMVARFDPPKRQDTLVKALAHLPERFHAVFVGGAPDNDGLLKVKILADKLSVSNRVHFLYTRSDIPRILKSTDIVLMSSEYEGLSLSSIEGMASGRPFIATNVNGLREVVDGAGELFQCGDAESLARLLQRFSDDKDFYNEVVAKCLSRSHCYDVHSVAEMYEAEYKKILKND